MYKEKNKKLFEEFEDSISNKYGHMAESMLILSEDFPRFFYDNKITIEQFTKNHINKLFSNYLDFIDLSEAECSMLFQILIDFCYFCKEKGVKINFFTEHLLKNKELIFSYWMSNEEIEKSFDNISTKEFIKNFDVYYNFIKHKKINQKSVEFDKKKVIEFLEKTHKLMKVTFEESLEIRKQNPGLSDAEYLAKIDKIVSKKYGQYLFAHAPHPDEIMNIVFSLPKGVAKRFFELTFRLEEVSNFKFGSIKRKKTIEEVLNMLENLINDIKENKELNAHDSNKKIKDKRLMEEESEEDDFWEEGYFAETLSSSDMKEKTRTFHMKHDEEMNYNCKKCNKKISAHNKDWHDGMCDDCFDKRYYRK